MSNNIITVFDIGGTNFRYAVIDRKSLKILEIHRYPTPSFLTHKNIIISKLQTILMDKISNIVHDIYSRYKSKEIVVGISFAGPITKDGIVKQACTIWGNNGFNYPIKTEIKNRLPKAKIFIINDITAAAERYGSLPKYQKYDYIGIITVSSGIGSKIYDIQHHLPVLDSLGIGGELGHVRFDFTSKAPICDCGGIGHIGAISSGRAIQRETVNFALKNKKAYKSSILGEMVTSPLNITNQDIIKAIQKNDSFAVKLLDISTYPLAISIANMSALIGVQKVIFIGGFALNCGTAYLKSVQRNLKKLDFYGKNNKEIPKIVNLGINDDNDPLIGVAIFVKRNTNEN
ncbi:MAG: ROK family protein [bacterium]|nr:ROK family protein [bacterium]